MADEPAVPLDIPIMHKTSYKTPDIYLKKIDIDRNGSCFEGAKGPIYDSTNRDWKFLIDPALRKVQHVYLFAIKLVARRTGGMKGVLA